MNVSVGQTHHPYEMQSRVLLSGTADLFSILNKQKKLFTQNKDYKVQEMCSILFSYLMFGLNLQHVSVSTKLNMTTQILFN